MDVFEIVKQSVSASDAAHLYGIEISRNGMAICPFHDDHDPSMKIDRRFHCFGCGADGDAIAFTARLFVISPGDAAQKLAQDFGLSYDQYTPAQHRPVYKKTASNKQAEQKVFRLLTDYLHLLKRWKKEYSPSVPGEIWHPLFVEAIQNQNQVEQALDFLLQESTDVKSAWLAAHEKDMEILETRRNYYMADKPTSKERLREITDGIEQGIRELFESEKYMRYLSVMSRFHKYSLNNTMLIYMQKPDATLVAGYNKWMNQFERHVKKGERGITIIAPTPFKKKIEEQKLDPDTKAPMLDQNGNIITEEKEIQIPMFRPVKVFDVSQTDGKPLPQLAANLTGNVQNYEVFMEALRRSAPVPITFEAMRKDTDGFFSPSEQRIAIRSGMSEVQSVSATVHEIAHSKLHNYRKVRESPAVEPPKEKDRNTEEVEAESVSYAVCQYYGIQTGENSFGYIANWSKDKELSELKASLELINQTAGELISDIDRNYQEICTERGINLKEQEIPYKKPIGRIDFLGTNGSISESVEYSDIQEFAYDIRAETHSGSPISIVLYKDENGKVIPHDFIFTLDPPPKGFQISDSPGKEISPKSFSLAATPEQLLDTYPMPDTALVEDTLQKCGYLDGDLLPLSKERAYELMANDLTVYMIQEGENPEMAFDTYDLDNHDGIFAISREEWEQSPEFHDKVMERQAHQSEREQAFLSYPADCFAIYQVKCDDPDRIRFMNMDWLKEHEIPVSHDNYDLIYTAPLTVQGRTDARLENLYEQFNLHAPADYHSPSLSVSDIIAIKQDGVVSCHYVDNIGFETIARFLPENHLKNAEMALEDDLSMIDGIINNGGKEPPVAELEQQVRNGQPIPLMDLAEATHRQAKKTSVLEKLKALPKQAHKKSAPKKNAEREI